MGNVIMVIKTEYIVYKKWLCKKTFAKCAKEPSELIIIDKFKFM